MATQKTATKEKISQSDYTSLLELSNYLGLDAVQFTKKMEEEEQEEREKMQKGFNSEMRSEAKRLKTFVTYKSYSSWTPQEMAAAGFYFTGVRSGIQCFCCGLILFGTSLQRLPIEDHKSFHPDCEFLLGKDVGNIAKYDIRVKNPEKKLRGDKAKYQEDKARLESFEDWPFYVHKVSPRELSAAGFVFTGKQDTVQCFACGGCLGNWEEGDDPWKEHAKWFPKCEFLQSKKSSEEIAQYIQSYKGFVGVMGEHFVNSWIKTNLPMASGIKDIVQRFSCGECLEKCEEGGDPLGDHTKYFPNCQFLQNMMASAEVIPDLQSYGELSELTETTSGSNREDSAAVSSTVPEMVQVEAQWFQEAKRLSERLREAYTNASFCRMSLLEVSSSLATDHLLGCDLSLASKHVSSPVQEPVVLPEVFANLNSVMCVEGEAGSGKTVLLKKTALLWASGCCSLLNRFQLVFYVSLSSTRLDQGLADIICNQLLETEGSVTEMCLRNIIRQLKNQVLFLLDDYKEMCSVPQVIEKLIQKNHSSRTCLLIAVRTNRARDIRQYLDTILKIEVFPFYNTIYVLRKFFPHNMTRLRKFMIHFGFNSSLQGIQKTPLFAAAVCAAWFQDPFDQSFDSVAVFKSYMECLFLKHKTSAELLKAAVSSCGQLALKGLFSSCFEFSDDDLIEAGVDEDEDLTMYLMSKFTAQRLRPVYQFLDPTFQECLAGMSLIALLDSDRQEDQDLGLYYLKQIKSSMITVSPFYYNTFLQYVSCYPSTKAGPKIVSHLLHLVDNNESLKNISENEDNLKHHRESLELVQLIRMSCQSHYSSVVSKQVLALALNIAYRSNTVAACSPLILQFLQGRTLTLDILSLQYFFDHPESLLLLRSIRLSIRGKIRCPRTDFSVLETCLDKSQAPTIDQDCASAFEPMKEWDQNLAEKEENIMRFLDMQLKAPPDISTGYWKLSPKQYKIPLLEVHVADSDGVDQEMLRVLMVVFSASQHIELHLNKSRGFMESLRPALEQYKASFTKCSIDKSELSAEEQELLLNLTSLESLAVSETSHEQDQLFPNLDKFLCLKELSVNLDKQNVFSVIPEEFLNLHHMEKLVIQISAEVGPSKLVKLIQNSPNLHVFHLKCNFFSDFESLMTVLASCKKLKEIKLSGAFFEAIPFVLILPNFISLKILNLHFQQFPDKEISEKFACTLSSLSNLEELILPTGDGIHQVAKLIIQQCQHLQCLRVLSFFQTLNDDSIMEIAKIAINGGFQKLEDLNLSINHKITEEGYRNFFKALDNLPNLQELTISRHFTECIKAQATTVKSLSQCILRLPSLIRLNMLSWLLDEEDITLLTSMKEKHPQSKYLIIHWKWVLPFSPIIQK
ncbi:baculoviral IAP repeat-containing protein 1 isoform X3 [Rousettus aegyptiacus]|uniref:NLR family apoptosis inhibitory protein n=2 Tax=Rousettus aegyptiacus TaxID=9407 RepID=A0A7J8F2Z5_ROUAE|nr:baculoviral IAP repeat-containing protein 1 isoform X3 [Rousettus aegyptiacus]XP_015977622.2 baculoviral IAP repeat-containing protein 1 isoform X3 [Rousettus aegyptiacus]XP_036082111.1 baculoviral IAP repeat-containing protein 1 isoform X3 [Rousettus aegyptiacus]KAF6441602.1 NLR family apoptosis inhibitory protein [Rousettus aegyptiacus]